MILATPFPAIWFEMCRKLEHCDLGSGIANGFHTSGTLGSRAFVEECVFLTMLSVVCPSKILSAAKAYGGRNSGGSLVCDGLRNLTAKV